VTITTFLSSIVKPPETFSNPETESLRYWVAKYFALIRPK
jgi:hypothetical protein